MGKAKAKGKAGGAPSKKTAQKKVDKIVEDKTFGLKNKNKSKKVQQYIQQVKSQVGTGGKSKAYHEAMAAQKKKEKEMQKQAEKEMMELLGEAYALDKKKKKKLNKKKEEEEQQKQEEEAQKQKVADEKDFGIPICALRDCFGLGSKATIERICVELVHKDNLPTKGPDGSPSLTLKVNDGTTLNPMTLLLIGETPQSNNFKQNCILDVRGCVAMLRGEKIVLEVPKGAQGLSQPTEGVECVVEVASERLTEFIRQKIEEEEEIRANGGIPIEERIEEMRASLPGPLTPVTHERFMAWKEKKRQQREKELEEKGKEVAKKSGGKTVLTGRALFQTDQSLFVDDADAVDSKAYDVVEHEDEENGTEPPEPPSDGEGDDGDDDDEDAAAIQEKLYLEGDDDLDDLDDLDDDDDDDDDEE